MSSGLPPPLASPLFTIVPFYSRTVKLKRSNTISANNNQASGGGGGGAHFGNSPGMNFHPQQAAHAVMAQKWMAQTIGSNSQQPGSATPSPNQV